MHRILKLKDCLFKKRRKTNTNNQLDKEVDETELPHNKTIHVEKTSGKTAFESSNSEHVLNALSDEIASKGVNTGHFAYNLSGETNYEQVNACRDAAASKEVDNEPLYGKPASKLDNDYFRRIEYNFLDLCDLLPVGITPKETNICPPEILTYHGSSSNLQNDLNIKRFPRHNKNSTTRDSHNTQHTVVPYKDADDKLRSEIGDQDLSASSVSHYHQTGNKETSDSSVDVSYPKIMNIAPLNHPGIDCKSSDVVEQSALDISQNEWQLQELITTERCFIQTKHSDVRLTIQQNSVELNTVISGSILLDIPFLRNKFKLPKTDIVVAPAVEYQLHDVPHLNLHACLELPHCMGSRNLHKMQVWWCENVRGNITKHAIRMIEKPLQDHSYPNIYWMKGMRRNTINVFAKHFCVILCTACEEDVEFDIRALLFHKFGDDSDHLSLSLHLHLGGPLSKIRDFEQATMEKMEKKRMTFLEDKDINLIPKLEGALRFNLEVLGNDHGNWVHVKRCNGRPVYEMQQKIDVKSIARCGNEHVINREVDWWLQRSTVLTNTCCFCTDVIHDVHISNADNESTATTTMHAELRVPKRHNTRNVDPNDSNLAFFTLPINGAT